MQTQPSFGHWLKELRTVHDLTQAQLADLLACSISTIRKLETGQRRPSRDMAERLTKHFDLPLEEIQSFVHWARTQASSEQSVAFLDTAQNTLNDAVGDKHPVPLVGQDIVAALARLEQEYESVRSMLNLLLEGANIEQALAMVGKGEQLWKIYGYLSEGRQRLRDGLTQSNDEPSLIRAKALHLAGALARTQADFEQAQTLHEQSLRLFIELGDDNGVASELDHLAWVAQGRGDYERSQELALESIASFKRLGDKQGVANALNHVGLAALYKGEYEQAVSLYQESLELAREIGNNYAAARAMNNLGEVARVRGAYQQAKAYYSQSLTMAEELKHKSSSAAALHNLGYLALHESDSASAESLFKNSLEQFEELGDRQGIAECLAGLGGVAVENGLPLQAVQLLGASTALLDSLGSPFQPTDQAEFQCYLTALRTSLDSEAFSIAWVKGQQMTTDQAIDYASTPTG